jgi:transcriptional regulator with XRE-family HTH domain
MTSHISKNLKTFRQAKRWSQDDFAKRLKISIPAYSKIDTGITDPNITRLYQMSQILDVNIIDLISKPGESPLLVNDVEFRQCQAKLSEAQGQVVVNLQQKIISLYEEVRELNGSKQITT